MDIEYSFLISAYNAETTIIATLESIKYQIVNFGKNYSVQLIIGDDCSTDRTRKIIDIWLKNNSYLFKKIDKVYHEKNEGTCRLFVDNIKHIQGNLFREISGDDLLSMENVFEIMDMTREYDIVTGYVLSFSNNHILNENTSYRVSAFQKYYTDKKLHFITQYRCPIQNGTVWNKRLMTDEVCNNILKYKLVEDRPMWFKIFKDNIRIQYKYIDKQMIFYRRSEQSITIGANTNIFSIYNNDIKMIWQDALDVTSSKMIRRIIETNLRSKETGKKNIYQWIFKIWLRMHKVEAEREYGNILENKERLEKYINDLNEMNSIYMKLLVKNE